MRELDAIARLVDEGFLSEKSLTENIYKKLSVTKDQFNHYRKLVQPNGRTEELRFVLSQFTVKDPVDGTEERREEAEKRLSSVIKRFREQRRPTKTHQYGEKS
jgi:hypothetical protein